MLMEFLAGVAFVLFGACVCYVFHMAAELSNEEEYGFDDEEGKHE